MSAAHTLEAIEFHLLNDFQRDFPLCPAPFAELAARLGVAEEAIINGLESLRKSGKISRVGAVFAPKRIGVSTLAAMAVPPEKLGEVAEMVNRFPEVNHNYEREHHYNLWFVATAGSQARLQAAIASIEKHAGYPVLQLPMLREFHIDLAFDLSKKSGERSEEQGAPAAEAAGSFALDIKIPPLEELERRLIMALQEGLPLFMRPFAVLAERVGCEEFEVLARIRRWCEEGVIKRFGVVVRHRELGYSANAMLVQDIPDDEVELIARRLAREPEITLCYLRPRVLPQWRYNLFCMIHGKEREEVLAGIAALRERLELSGFAHDILFSLACFKQNGARYA
ncbi:MAG: Lrp/AsnC family transcriptional regulator [Betaproteobacteria bacterium]|nr:Lrp/AsnC family transcriptional regulator [Betaproteobacteria bacterium]